MTKRREVVSSCTIIAIHLEKWTHLSHRGRDRKAGRGWCMAGVGPRAHTVWTISNTGVKSPKTRLCRSSDRCGLQKSPQMISETLGERLHDIIAGQSRQGRRCACASPSAPGLCDISQSIAQLRAPDRCGICRETI